MKHSFDVLFIDVTTPIPYSLQTLSVRGLGGTEATVIRVAECLSTMGLRVGVVVHNLDFIVCDKGAYYLPLDELDNIEATNVVMLRGVQYADKFPQANKFSWHEDVPTDLICKMRDTFIAEDITVVAASEWHKVAIQELICRRDDMVNPRVVHIYNPVPDILYIPKDMEIKYDKNKLVWPASPHKGLDKAVAMVDQLVEVSGNKDFRLHIFNPGYFGDNECKSQYVINHGAVPCQELWQHMSEALCMFYPTQFKETFGCIAAEANAVHTPVLTCELAGLAETVSSARQFVRYDPKEVIDKVLLWHNGERPVVWGQNRFRLSEVAKQWYKMLRPSLY